MSNWRLCVDGILYKVKDDMAWILTQRRKVKNHEYDTFYDNTWENMSETVKEGEEIVDAIRRGLFEECGLSSDSEFVIQWVFDNYLFTSDCGERMSCVHPLCYLHSSGKPQLWTGPAFLIKVPTDFEPSSQENEGEVGEYKWWLPSDLFDAITRNPEEFIAYSRPALRIAAYKLQVFQMNRP